MIANYINRLGVLRGLLALLLVALVALAPFAGGHGEHSSWGTLPTIIAPAFVPILFFVVLFDVVMGRVVMSGAEREKRYGTILWTYVVLLGALTLAWGPFYASLF